MKKKKIISKISAGVIAGLLALQGLAPSITVMADEITEPEEPIQVIEITESEPSETAETSETEAEETESPTTETDPSESETVEEMSVSEEVTEETTPIEMEATESTKESIPEETEVVDISTNDIAQVSDADAFTEYVASMPSDNRLVAGTSADIDSNIDNATGVSFDGVYVLSIEDEASYNEAISYFEANDIAYAVDGEVSLCSIDRFEHIVYGEINPDATTKIAIIDTGSNTYNEAYSVIDEDVSDSHGHGTAMSNYVLSQTDDAYIISIKAIGSDGTGNVSDLCAAMTLAMNNDVDVILMALSVRDNGEYEAFEQLIAEAQARGITVIASAGNNNTDASNYLPAGAANVITVGAVTESGYKLESSNYGDCVDYYVNATSTSEASALFAGLYIAGDTEDVATTYIPADNMEAIPDDTDLAEVNFTKIQNGVYLFVTEDQMVAAGYTSSDDFRNAVISSCDAMTGAGYAQSGGNGSVGEKVDCITYTHIAYANALGGISDLYQSGGKVYFSGSCNGWGPWNLYTTTGATGCTSWLSLNGIGSPSSAGVNPDTNSLSSLGVEKGDLVLFGKSGDGYWHHAAIYDGSENFFWQARGSAYTAGRSARSDVTVNENTTGFNRILVLHIEDFEQNAEMTIVKAPAAGYDVVTDGNSCYNLAGTTYTLYSDSACTSALTSFTVGSDGKTDTTYQVSPSTTYYLKETVVGAGFAVDNAVYEITTGGSVKDDITVKNLTTGASFPVSANDKLFTILMTDIPVTDPISIRLDKVTTEGQHTTADINNAVFRLEFYAQDIGFDSSVSGMNPTTVFEFALDGTSKTVTLNYLAGLTATAGTDVNYFKDIKNADIIDGYELPLGTYRLYEIDAPDGYTLNAQVLRYRIYQDAGSGSTAKRACGVEGTAPNGYNYFSHTLDESNPDYDQLLITLNETTKNGSYSLTKSLQDDEILDELNGAFNFELYNTTDNTLIATGVSKSDGRVCWTYVLPNLYAADNPKLLLTGTSTYELELAVYNDGEAKINYEVREIIPTTLYGNTQIAYAYTTPSGWTRSADSKYFYKKINLTTDQLYADTIQNNIEFGSIRLHKDIPMGDTFDRTKVTFYLYETNTNTLIATGTVDSNGNICWTKKATSGFGVRTSTRNYTVEIDSVTHLPLGTYKIVEVWNRYYVESLDESVQIQIDATNNTNDWVRSETATQISYTTSFTLTTDEQVFAVTSGKVTNDEHVQWFNMKKTVVVEGDAGTITAELYYITDDGEYVLMATGSCETDGIGIYYFTWEYNGVSEMRSGVQTLKLPEGNYQVREYIGTTYYQNGRDNVPYTYMCPVGFKPVYDESGLHPEYFYKDFRVSNNSVTVNTQNIRNIRIEASLELRKVEETNNSNIPERDFTFEIYYRGNEAEAQNVGVFTEEYLLDTVVVHTVNGSGMVTLDKIPEGWYEIREIGATDWKCTWVGTDNVTATGSKIVRAYCDDITSTDESDAQLVIRDGVNLFGTIIPGILAFNRIAPDVTVIKYDLWTAARIINPALHPDNIHLTFYLYEDINGNGKLDELEKLSFIAKIDGADAGDVVFEDLDAGKYILHEVATINGYYLTAADIPFEIKDAVSFDLTPANMPYTEPVKVTKIDNETEELLSGAVFNIYVDVNDNGTYEPDVDTLAQAWVDTNGNGLIDDGELVDCVMEETSTGVYVSNGELHFNDGDTFGNQYLLVETKAPDGYFFVNDDGTFTNKCTVKVFKINAADTTAADFVVGTNEFTVRNQTGTVVINKVNDKGEFLTGAEFTIYADAECTEVIGKLIEDAANQRYYYKGLNLGTYYIRETRAPEYYIADPNVYRFDITVTQTKPVVDNFNWIEITGVYGSFINFNPIVSTTLTDSETKEHITSVAKEVTLIDTVEYRGLTVGKTYIMEGYLYDKATGEKLWDAEGNPIMATVRFTPKSSNGTVDVEFVIDTTVLQGKSIVAAEYCSEMSTGRYVGIHFDLNDEGQTVKVPEIHTTLTQDGSHTGNPEGTVVLTDIVTYKNLIVGKTYILTGTLMDKATGEVLLDENSNPITATTTFTATETDGQAEVTFTVSGSLLVGKTVVAFETLEYNGVAIAIHADINDEGQTVTFPTPTPTPTTPPPFIPSTGEQTSLSQILGIIAVAIGGGISAIILIRRKKKDDGHEE